MLHCIVFLVCKSYSFLFLNLLQWPKLASLISKDMDGRVYVLCECWYQHQSYHGDASVLIVSVHV